MRHLPAEEKRQRLETLPEVLAREIKGQDHALPRIVSALRRGELGLTRPGRPRSGFLLLGPTGVGKTETVVVATDHLFGPGNLLRLDMSEFQNQDATGLLLGSRPGEAGYLGNLRARTDEGSLLLDEIEKAHPRVLDLLLQLLDAARITVATGETLDFSRFHIWLTSNIGAVELLGVQHSTEATLERHVLARAQAAFRPEIFARIPEKLVFRRLSFDVQMSIAAKLLEQELAFLKERGIEVETSPDLLPDLVRRGFHPKLGARPLRETVERTLGEAAVAHLLAGQGNRPVRLRVAPATDTPAA